MEVSSPLLPPRHQWILETKDSHDWMDSTNRSVVCSSWDQQDLSWPLFLEDTSTAYQQPKRVSMDTCDTTGAFLDDPMLFDYANDWCADDESNDDILALIPPDDNSDQQLLSRQFHERCQQLAACMQKTRESRACLHQGEAQRPELQQVLVDIEKSTQAIQEAMDVVEEN